MQTKDNRYKHADQDGSYSVFFGDRTIEVKFVGFLSEKLVEKYCQDFELMLRVIEWKQWGYYANLIECDDESATTRKVLVELNKRMLKMGCVVDAYTVTNSVTISHLIKSRKSAGISDPSLDKNLFSNRQQAIDYIHSILNKIDNKIAK